MATSARQRATRVAWAAAAIAAASGLPGGEAQAAPRADAQHPGLLEVPHQAPAYYVPPRARGKKQVIVWLHGRSGDPEADCKKWAKVTVDLGWLLCPSGPEARGGGQRGWNNNWAEAQRAVDAAVEAFHDEFGSKVQRRDHLLIGFSEGALVAMNVGVREPERFSRWLILAANDVYWGAEGQAALHENRGHIKRVYLLTGEKDQVVENTRRVHEQVERERVTVRIWTPADIGHEVPADRMRTFYRKPLRWLLGLKG